MNSQTHHITIVSEQLWPHLLGLNYLRENGGVKTVHLVHTDDNVRSKAPAERLKSLTELLLPGVQVYLHQTSSQSQAVYHTASHIIGLYPTEQWSINCTGGTKLMLAGLIPLLENPRVTAFYREASGDWYRLNLATAGGQRIVSSDYWREPAGSRLALPVIALVEAQGLYPSGASWSASATEFCDPLAVIRAGLDNNWMWNKLMKLIPGSLRPGFAFETLFASLLHELGAANFATQLKLTNNGLPAQEFDIVASTGQKLVLFDLKLKNEHDDAKIDQLSRIAENRRSLGGLGGSAVAVRPSWGKSESLKAIAKAYSVELWTADDMYSIIEKLAGILDIDSASLNPSSKAMHELIQAAHRDGKRIFSTTDHVTHYKGQSCEEQIGEINATTYFNTLKSEENKQLIVISCDPWLIVYGTATLLSKLKDTPEIRELSQRGDYQASENSDTAQIRILPKHGKAKEIKRLLRSAN